VQFTKTSTFPHFLLHAKEGNDISKESPFLCFVFVY
jgi:hypothetical protein